MNYNTKAPILMATGARSQQCINGFVPKASNRVTIVGKQCPCLDVSQLIDAKKEKLKTYYLLQIAYFLEIEDSTTTIECVKRISKHQG
jgi:hypothetical protein